MHCGNCTILCLRLPDYILLIITLQVLLMLCSDLEDIDKDIAALDIVLDKCLTELNLEERVKITYTMVSFLISLFVFFNTSIHL